MATDRDRVAKLQQLAARDFAIDEHARAGVSLELPATSTRMVDVSVFLHVTQDKRPCRHDGIGQDQIAIEARADDDLCPIGEQAASLFLADSAEQFYFVMMRRGMTTTFALSITRR